MEKYHPAKFLEVTIHGRSPDSWEWQVRAGDRLIVSGLEDSRFAAKFAGDDAMLLLLASGQHP
jgi:hypothetical protein